MSQVRGQGALTNTFRHGILGIFWGKVTEGDLVAPSGTAGIRSAN